MDGICSKEIMDRLISANICSTEKVQHDVELNLKWSQSASEKDNSKVPKGVPSHKSGNLKISVKFCDSFQ